MPDSYLTTEQAAKMLDVRVDEIYRLIRSGRLKARKVNRIWTISPAAITARSVIPVRRNRVR